MLEAFVVTFREGVEVALILGIVLACVRKTGRETLVRFVWGGLAIGVLGSLAGAAAMQAATGGRESEVLEGAVMLAGAALVGTLLVWMQRAAREMRGHIEGRLERLSVGALGLGAGLGVLLFSAVMVLREGAETVLFLYALSFQAQAAALWTGAALGLAAAAALGALFVRGSLRINLRKFFWVTSLMLGVLVGELAMGGLHEWMEVGLVPSNPAFMSVAGPVVNYPEISMAVFLLIPAAALLVDRWVRDRPMPDAAAPRSAERRMMVFRAQRRRFLKLGATALIYGAAVGAFSSLAVAARARPEEPPQSVNPAAGGELRIPLADLDGTRLRKFAYASGGVAVRFFVLKAGDGRAAAAFDACAVCGPIGYRLEGENVICINCGAPIFIGGIGQVGGCNPIPLEFRTEGAEVVVRVADLERGQALFRV